MSRLRITIVFLIMIVATITGFGDRVPEEVWNFCRASNKYIAMLAFFGVSIRLGMMLGDKNRGNDHRAMHITFWFATIALSLLNSSLAAGYYDGTATDANYTSGNRIVLHLVTIGLVLWWPHPRRYTPLEIS